VNEAVIHPHSTHCNWTIEPDQSAHSILFSGPSVDLCDTNTH